METACLAQFDPCSEQLVSDSIVVSIPVCHIGDPGSIPGPRALISDMVQWLGFLAFTEAAGVRFPVSEFICVDGLVV
ncbi:hypothetical protein AYI69_g5729 [Smittium culicis]|uniref:Uncharacterized protein n=1 Tax=Smittium culicis TaxID=133412 RepID=A0A1R1Y3W6_9FUNG|nr:hypothetical protein AYI69_g5729 [Smittium culicis]